MKRLFRFLADKFYCLSNERIVPFDKLNEGQLRVLKGQIEERLNTFL